MIGQLIKYGDKRQAVRGRREMSGIKVFFTGILFNQERGHLDSTRISLPEFDRSFVNVT